MDNKLTIKAEEELLSYEKVVDTNKKLAAELKIPQSTQQLVLNHQHS